jgi:hypothetical protein
VAGDKVVFACAFGEFVGVHPEPQEEGKVEDYDDEGGHWSKAGLRLGELFFFREFFQFMGPDVLYGQPAQDGAAEGKPGVVGQADRHEPEDEGLVVPLPGILVEYEHGKEEQVNDGFHIGDRWIGRGKGSRNRQAFPYKPAGFVW